MIKGRKVLSAFVALGLKVILCLLCLSAVTIALVTYPAAVTVTPTQQLTTGATSATWQFYVNEVNEVRYLPGDFSEPTLNTSDTNTYALKVVTDSNKVCAVKIELTAAVNSSKFSNFEVTVRSSTGGAWSDETLYAASTGATTKTYVDGLVSSDAAYIHQAVSTTKYYEIKVTYSYDKVDETAQIAITFQYTPLPQDNFT